MRYLIVIISVFIFCFFYIRWVIKDAINMVNKNCRDAENSKTGGR